MSIRRAGLVRVGFRRAGSGDSGGLPSPLTPDAVLFVNSAGTKATTSTQFLYKDGGFGQKQLAVLGDATALLPTDSAFLVVKKTSGAVSAIFDGGGVSPNLIQLKSGGGGTRDAISYDNPNGFQIGGAVPGFNNSGIQLDPGNPGFALTSFTSDGWLFSSNVVGPLVRLDGNNNLQMQVNGTAANPALSFLNSAGTGLFLSAANVLAVATNNAEIARFTSTGLGLQNGAVGAPSAFFVNSTTTGIYRSAANVLGIAASGTAAMTVAQNQVVIRPGTVGTPSFVLTSGDTTGLYRNAANDVAFGAGGVRQGGWTSNGMYFLNKVSFFGAAAVGQRAKTGTAPAGAAYGANEQAMLNDCFNTLLGLGVLV